MKEHCGFKDEHHEEVDYLLSPDSSYRTRKNFSETLQLRLVFSLDAQEHFNSIKLKTVLSKKSDILSNDGCFNEYKIFFICLLFVVVSE